MIKHKYKTIATLGPVGTDAEYVAKSIGSKVLLFDSFEKAMIYACKHDVVALVACGYVKKDSNNLQESWVDLHFRFILKLKIKKIILRKTKTICVAFNSDKEVANTMIIHPSTEEFTKGLTKMKTTYSQNKPEAVHKTAMGLYDACIGSEDIIKKYPNLKIVSKFEAQMVWSLYKKF